MQMKHLVFLTVLSVSGTAAAYDREHWPTNFHFQNGTDLGLSGNFQYDRNSFHGDSRFANQNDSDFRRQEFGASIGQKGIFDATVNYDFQNELWLDTFVRLETKAVFGDDYGKVTLGYMKVPFGLDALTSSRATALMETNLADQAIIETRRLGGLWSFERPKYALQVGAYGGKDLQGDNPGVTQAIRGVWTPIRSADQVLHLGLAISQESPRGYQNGRGTHFGPRVRFRARPEAGLTSIRLVDSGTLTDVDHIDRTGLEVIWLHGPYSIQGESLGARVKRNDGGDDYVATGQTIQGTYSITGESRPYSVNGLGNIKPIHPWGAVELAARYSHLDLNDEGIAGGRQTDWTLGANWYLTSHFKFQANYTLADSKRFNMHDKPKIFELRAQVQF